MLYPKDSLPCGKLILWNSFATVTGADGIGKGIAKRIARASGSFNTGFIFDLSGGRNVLIVLTTLSGQNLSDKQTLLDE